MVQPTRYGKADLVGVFSSDPEALSIAYGPYGQFGSRPEVVAITIHEIWQWLFNTTSKRWIAFDAVCLWISF